MKESQNAVPTIVLETRRPHKDGRCAVNLRVTYKRKSRYYVMKYPLVDDPELKDLEGQAILLSTKEFISVNGEKPRGKYNTLKLIFAGFESKAIRAISQLKPFNFDGFTEKFFQKPTTDGDVFGKMTAKAKKLRNEGRISTAITYECAVNSLKEFTGKADFPFENVTVDFLKKYQAWMLSNGRSKTTIGMYLRDLRAVFNESKLEGLVYPFGPTKRGLYQIPKGANVKKALTIAQVSQIAGYSTIDGTFEQRSRDFWLFSYLCNGINVKDMARLKYSNIFGDKIILNRSKTAETVEEDSPIEIYITPQIGRIIDKWGNKPSNPDQYILPILSPQMTAEQEYRAIQQTVQTINKNMKRIAKAIGIEEPITSYTARHSFATVLKRSGASIEFISESLGHRNKQTTQNYLAKFEDDVKKAWAEKLLPENY